MTSKPRPAAMSQKRRLLGCNGRSAASVTPGRVAASRTSIQRLLVAQLLAMAEDVIHARACAQFLPETHRVVLTQEGRQLDGLAAVRSRIRFEVAHVQRFHRAALDASRQLAYLGVVDAQDALADRALLLRHRELRH